MIIDRIKSQRKDLETLPENYRKRTKELVLEPASLITVVIGPRRAGKSTFIINSLKDKKFGYANFDDELLTAVANYDDITGAINQVYDNPELLFFDEIQNLPGWELFVNRLHRQGKKLVITGSNSNLLSGELATHLTGRYIPVNIFPFSFTEYLVENPALLSSQELMNSLMAYLQTGGFPEVVTGKNTSGDYLRILHDSIIFKDIIKRYSLRKFDGLIDLARYLVNNSATEISDNQLAGVLNLSVHTVKRFLNYLENAFLLFRIERFSYKMKERIKYNKKIFVFDTGFITSLSTQYSANLGRYFETLVGIVLKKEALDGTGEVFYYRNAQNEEVDFVIKKGLEVVELIQVSYSIENPKTLEREVRSLIKAGKELNCNNLTLLNSTIIDQRDYTWFGTNGTIRFTRLDQWLLERGG